MIVIIRRQSIIFTKIPAHRPALTLTMSRHLQCCASEPAAVAVQLFLAFCGAELHQLLLLQLVGGKRRQQLKEGAARHSGYVQVALHQVAYSARLRKPGWN